MPDALVTMTNRRRYVCQAGPCYETPAECRFFRMIGGDACGACFRGRWSEWDRWKLPDSYFDRASLTIPSATASAGMSTANEAIACRHLGMRVFAVALITNKVGSRFAVAYAD